MMLNSILRNSRRWLSNSAQKALDEAYQAALKIESIEKEHFKGQKISAENSDYGESVLTYFQSELNSHLQTINLKIAQFKTSNFWVNISGNYSHKYQEKNIHFNDIGSDNSYLSSADIALEKLKFIDKITDKYKYGSEDLKYSYSSQKKQKSDIVEAQSQHISDGEPKLANHHDASRSTLKRDQEPDLETVSDKTGVLPRSFLRTINRIKQEIDPKSAETEEEVVNKFRKSRYKTAISIKFLLLLIIVPLLVHNISKIALGQLFIDPYFANHEQLVFLNQDLQEEAFIELKNYEESLQFKSMIGLIPELPQEQLEEELKHKAEELAEDYRQNSADAIKNIFADLLSIIAFAILIVMSKREVLILKSFLDEMVYGLSDSAKAFLIILFTDMFVGFHSPHGWEVILEGISRHFGIGENREFNFLFIATFPVILDTVLKYWIFRYLNRISPSAVATYKNMNES